jgi:ubiquinone/menaquinone biosynthesis C-methylase UbiE
MTAHERRFDPSAAFKLEDPERRVWLPPDDILARLPLRADLTVADIGAGTGYFAIPLAGRVKRVFAVDVQPEMLELLRSKLSSSGSPANIELVHGSADRTSLESSSCDLVFLANVWHEFDDTAEVLREVRRILKPEGSLAILDWRPDVDRPPGPPLEHRVAPDAVHKTLSAAGWAPQPAQNVGRYSYLILAGGTR